MFDSDELHGQSDNTARPHSKYTLACNDPSRSTVTSQCFDELYQEYWVYVFAICWIFLDDEDAAQRVAQEVFVRQWKAIQQDNPSTAQFKVMLHHQAVLCCLERMRKKDIIIASAATIISNSVMPEASPAPAVPGGQPAEPDLTFGHELSTTTESHIPMWLTLEHCFARLFPEQRVLIQMRYIDSYTWEEIAALCRISFSQVRRDAAVAMRDLMRCLLSMGSAQLTRT